jgi:hypothetical protein
MKKLLLPILALAAATALYFGWRWAGQSSQPAAAPVSQASVNKAKPISSPPPPTQVSSTPEPAPTESKIYTAEEGEALIDQTIRADKDHGLIAKDLHELVKKLNGEPQVNASRHLCNLAQDENYKLIGDLLIDPKLNPDVLEVLYADLMNRNRALQMPYFMNLLKNPAHPQNQSVRDVLTVLAGEDFGQNWAKWEAWGKSEAAK